MPAAALLRSEWAGRRLRPSFSGGDHQRHERISGEPVRETPPARGLQIRLRGRRLAVAGATLIQVARAGVVPSRHAIQLEA